MPITIAQHVVIKFLTNENVGPNEIWHILHAQYKESTLLKTQVKFWHKEFRRRRDAVQNTSHHQRSRTSITPENITVVHDLFEGDCRLTVVKICQELGTRISYGSVQSIIKNKLLFRKISAQWVPRLLSDKQKTAHVQISETLLACYKEEGDTFIHRIVTCKETWVHHYTPEMKTASKEWRGKGEEYPVKAKMRLSAGKVMATVFWDFKGVLLIDFLHARRTINAAYYCDLLEKVRAAYRSKRRGLPIRNMPLLHIVRPHSAALTQEKLAQMYWTALEHLPYSPDLSPCEYHIFGPLKETLGGQHFDDDEQVEDFVHKWLQTCLPSFYEAGIKKTPNPLAKMHRER